MYENTKRENSHMKKIALSFVSVLMLLILGGCSSLLNKGPTIDDLKKTSGVMMVAESSYVGIVTKDDYIESTVYTVNFDGSMTAVRTYHNSGVFTTTETLTDDDLMLLFSSCNKMSENRDDIDNYQVDLAGNIPKWKITFYNDKHPNGINIANGVYAGGHQLFDIITGVLEYYVRDDLFTNSQGVEVQSR